MFAYVCKDFASVHSIDCLLKIIQKTCVLLVYIRLWPVLTWWIVNFVCFFNVFEAHGACASMYVMILLILRRRPHNNYNALLNSLLGVF